MQEPVSRSDVNSITQEYKETVKAILNALVTKIKSSNKFTVKGNEEIVIQVGKDRVYKSKLNQEPTENKLTPEHIKQIQIALEKPQELKGSVSILVGDERIFHAKDGQVIEDTLSLTSSEQQLSIRINQKIDAPNQGRGKDSVVQAIGRGLAHKASKMLAFLGKRAEDNSLQYESNNYIFTQKEKQLSIVAKDGRGEILNQNGFTEVATDKDITSLQQIGTVIQQLEVNNSPSQSNLKRSI